MSYIPHTYEDEQSMLHALGLQHQDQLFDEIPAELAAPALNLPESLNEMQVLRLLSAKAGHFHERRCFIGFGAYAHHIPAAVWDIVGRGEFMTAYTPYQAEASQGTLQVIYEFQSMMAMLTGMDVCNASVYDGASGLAEAVLMALRLQKKHPNPRVLVPDGVHPWYRQTLRSIVSQQGIQISEVGHNDKGQLDPSRLDEEIARGAAVLVLAQPNCWGVLDDVDALTDQAQKAGIKVVALVNPTSLALLKPPGLWGTRGADLVVGDAQPLGIPLSSGGPYVGFLACRIESVRQLPGRLVGRTVDVSMRPGFTLTLQAREQHIRRAKATSNICTNQGLAMSAATIYMSLLGAEGLARVAAVSHQRMLELSRLLEDAGIEPFFASPVFHERLFRLPVPVQPVLQAMAQRGFEAGVDMERFDPSLQHGLLVCTTELLESEDVRDYAQSLMDVIREIKA